jgi:hypothetical protein
VDILAAGFDLTTTFFLLVFLSFETDAFETVLLGPLYSGRETRLTFMMMDEGRCLGLWV